MDACFFPAMDTELDPLLSSPDFLAFLSDHDLTGPLPVIPDATTTVACRSPEITSSMTAAPPAVLSAPRMQPAATQHQVPLNTSTAPSAASLQPVVHYNCAVQQQQPALFMQQLQQHQQVLQPQTGLKLEPSRTMSVSSSDASGGRIFAASAPGSPTSSPPPSYSDVSSLPVQQPRLSTGTSTACSPVDGPVAKRARTQQQQPPSTVAAAQQQQDKPLTKQQIAANKRRAPEIDWRSIEDPAERRRQRRLAKNRITAARSRERKKEQMADMEERMSALEQENAEMRALMASLTQENSSLKEQLASLTRGAAAINTGSSPEPAVHKCLAIMHLVACLSLAVKVSLWFVVTLLSVLVQQGLLTSVSSAVGVFGSSRMPALTSATCGKQLTLGRADQQWLSSSCSFAGCRPRSRGVCGDDFALMSSSPNTCRWRPCSIAAVK